MTKLNNIILLYGEEEYLINNYYNKIIDENLKFEYRDFNLSKYHFKGLDFNTVLNSLETLPLFDDKKIIIIDDIDLSKKGISSNGNFIDKLYEYLDRIPNSSLLILIYNMNNPFKGKLYKKINKIGTIKEFRKMEYAELKKYISDYLNRNEINIKTGSIDYIIDKTAYFNKDSNKNLYDLNNELSKLANRGKEITNSEIDLLFTNSLENNIFKLTDAIVEKNISKSLKIYYELLQSSDDSFRIFYMIIRTIRNLLTIKECIRLKIPDNEITKKYSISFYETKKIRPFSKVWKYDELRTAIHLAYSTEVELKSSSLSSKKIIEKYILDILR